MAENPGAPSARRARAAPSRPHRLHALSVAVLVITVAAAATGTLVSLRLVRDNDRRLLQQDTGQAALVTAAYLSHWQDQIAALATAVRDDANRPVELAQETEQAYEAGGYAGVALLHLHGGAVERATGVGELVRNPLAGSLLVTVTRLLERGGSAGLGFTGSGKARRMGWLVGTPLLPRHWAAYVEAVTPQGTVLPNLPRRAFSDVELAAYLGAERPDRVLFASGGVPRHPARAEHAVMSVTGDLDSVQLATSAGSGSDGDVLLAVRARRSLSGVAATLLPWLLLASGAFGAVVFTGLLEAALRRRDEALASARRLRQTNLALDSALARQAEAESELREAQRLEAVGQLAGGIAHDFNNLLAVIVASAAFVAGEVGPGPAQEDLAEIRRAAKAAADLTRQLLIFSRRDTVEPSVVDVDAVLADAQLLLRRTLGEDVELVWRPCSCGCTVLSDRGELEQVLMNLAVNARDAMPTGGRLLVTTERVTVVTGEAAVPPGEYVRLVVEDTGVGMPPETVARAFEPFFTTKETARGTGLGLATVYGIVTRWGGQVSLRSAPGAGTAVTVLLPVSTATAVEEPAARPRPGRPAGRPATVLVVEDDAVLRRVARRVLESDGHQVLEAATGAQAIDRLGESELDLVVTDVVMPGGMTGRELADRLAGLRPELPVVFVSGYGADALADRGVVAGGPPLVRKPYSPDVLLGAVREALARGVGALS